MFMHLFGSRTWDLIACFVVAWTCVFTCSLGTEAQAQTITNDEIPPELRAWIPWVSAELGDEVCTPVHDNRRCQWPGVLELELKEEGGTFTLFSEVDARGLRPIVGGYGPWPQNVRVNGELKPVVSHGGQPAVLLDVGRHQITGTLIWSRLPETLYVGADVAFINLSVLGKAIPLVKREHDKIWLKGLGIERLAEGDPEHVELYVFRQLRDGVPLLVETRIVFQVAGKARELSLPQPLLGDTIPLSVSGDLAVALEPSGALRVQLVPGRHEIHLLARRASHVGPLKNRPRGAPWPEQEIWTFRALPELRSVELNGLVGIDASRTELPPEWRSDGAYVARADSALELVTTRRGEAQIPNNKLHFQREFWLDEAARGFTVRDTVRGSMHQGWRLNLVSGELGSVRVGGEDQVITKAQGLSGVEIRDGELDLVAVSRVPRTSELSAVGWSEDASTLSAVFHLPPGWDVFSVSGVDDTSATWLSRWDLFDVFYLLLVTFSMFRLTGNIGGAACAVALVLCHEEAGAPEYIWLPLVALAALLSLIKEGRFRSWLSFGFHVVGIFALISVVAFSVDQVRLALFPHLESHGASSDYFQSEVSTSSQYMTLSKPSSPEPVPAPADMALPEEDAKPAVEQLDGGAPPPPPAPAAAPAQRSLGPDLVRKKSAHLQAEYRHKKGADQTQHKSDAIVQTGPGIPESSGLSVQLGWSGPVVQKHKISLWLVSPTMNRFLTVLRLLSLAGLLYFLYQLSKKSGGKFGRRMPSRSSQAVATALFAAGFVCAVPQQAHADEPSDERLSQLKERLSKKPDCFPECVSVSLMKVTVGETLTATMEVHAGAAAAYKLPGPASILSQAELVIDGARATAVRLEADGAYYLRVPKGVHQVVLRTSLGSDRFTMDVGTLPQRVEVTADGWSVSGVNEQSQVPGGTLTLQRTMAPRGSGAGTDTREENRVAVPPFFHVERHLRLNVTGSVTTRIRRVSDASSPEVMRLKLLPGERLTTPGIEVKNGVAELSFPREESLLEVSSTIVLPSEKKDLQFELTAPEASEGSETWKLECGVVYHCSTSGVVPSSHLEEGRAVHFFQPWPKEVLKIHATEPAPAAGSSLTVHNATLTLRPGVRSGQGKLELAIQTSRSVVHAFSIPKSARLESVTVDGRPQAVKSEDGKVRVSLAPGTALIVAEWHAPEGLKALFSSPQVHTGAPGVNFRTVIDLPSERWLLLVGGPPRGPALLFWGYLLLIVGAAILLPRIAFSHLKTRDWLLLGLGLTQVPAAVAVFIAGWFFAMSSRSAWPFFGRMRQNLLQLGLVAYTFFFLIALGGAVYSGLVSSPDMEVQGAGSYNGHLVFVVDRSAGALPQAWVLSESIWVWRGFMLLWALWLAWALLGWLKWAFFVLNQGGFWLPKPVVTKPPFRAPEAQPIAPGAQPAAPAPSTNDALAHADNSAGPAAASTPDASTPKAPDPSDSRADDGPNYEDTNSDAADEEPADDPNRRTE